MPIQVKKKERENTQMLIHRFTRAVRESGTLMSVRKKRFRTRPKSAKAKKMSALRRVELKKQRASAEKLGR